MKKLAIIATIGTVSFSAAARADVIAYDNAAGVTGLQNFGNSLGLDFNVNTPITITSLGVFDNGALANLDGVDSTGTGVEIVDLNSGLVVVPEVLFSSTNSGTQVNGDNFKAISPVVLPVGNYTVTAFNSDNFNTNGGFNGSSTTDSGGGAISFVGGGRYGFGHVDLPPNPDGGPPNRYDSGTFTFSVPEPASTAVLGLTSIGLLSRRRRS